MALEYLEKVYCLAPCLRLLMDGEESTGKHLFSFFQFEIEWKTDSISEVFKVGEALLKNTATEILNNIDNGKVDVNEVSLRNINSLIDGNYSKITYSEALEMLGKDPSSKVDLTPEEDAELTEKFDKPFWIYDYPEGVRDSIYHKNSSGTYDTYDLMLPFGYGELTTGGIRPKTSSDIIAQSKALGTEINLSYAKWKDKSKIQTAGFGIGLERFFKFVSGSPSIMDFIQYHDNGPNSILINSL